ncbi:MAG: hypothetical protein JXB39_15430, partial [Deltaproteobacteria bacterium]|nr:hypothetical protein [Deltaproteobacteria bacterium]
DTDTDTDVDTGLPPCRDGHYTGPFGFEASALGGAIEDRCEGTVELDILEAAEPQIEGTVRCAFKGVIASLGLSSEYGGSLVGALGTHPEASGQLGVAIDTDSVSDDWSGSFEADTLLGAFDGAFTFSYSDRTYEASYTGAFQATLE